MTTYSPKNLNPIKDKDALLVLFISIVIMLLTGGIWYLFLIKNIYLQAKNSPYKLTNTDAVYLVFGKKLLNNVPDLEYQSRLIRLLACPYRQAILMGGKTGTSQISEAQAGYDFLQNINPHPLRHISLESSSQNTLENLQNTRQLLNNQTVVIISNRYHLTRCSTLAKGMGIKHQLCAAEPVYHFDTVQLIKYLQEAFYIHWFACGQYWAQLTRNQRMLDKIQ